MEIPEARRARELHPAICKPDFRTRQLIQRLLVILMAVIALLSAPIGVQANGRYYNSENTIQTSHPDWMKWVPDSVKLSELSLPGTHYTMGFDTGFLNGTNDIVQTQGLRLSQQLAAGIRVLHIKVEIASGKFVIQTMGGLIDGPDFSEVLSSVNGFLSNHPTETVMILLEREYADSQAGFISTMNSYRTDKIVDQANQTLGDVRGKIVVVLDSSDHFSTSATIQNDDDVDGIWDINNKWAKVKSHLKASDQGDQNLLYINFLSGVGGGENSTAVCLFMVGVTADVSFGGPEAAAIVLALAAVPCGFSAATYAYPYAVAGGSTLIQGVNDFTLDYLLTRTTSRTGIMMMDFPGAAIIDTIIAHNFHFATNVTDLASDFGYMYNNIAYNGTEIGGSQQALDRLALLSGFANYVFRIDNPTPNAYIDSLVWSDGAQIGINFDDAAQGIYKQTDWIDTDNIFETRTYSSIAFNVTDGGYLLDPVIRSGNPSALKTLVDQTCPTLAGEINAQATTLSNAVKSQFAQFTDVHWNVLVKQGFGGYDNWAYSTLASTWSPIGQNGSLYDTGGSNHRCVVWGYRQSIPPPPPPENNAPTFVSFEKQVGFITLFYEVVAQDSDSDPLTITATTLPDWVIFDDYGDGTAYAHLPIGFQGTLVAPAGNWDITLQLSDGKAPPVSQAFTFKINGEPTFVSPSILPSRIEGSNTWDIVTVDVNGDPVTITATSLPSGLVFTDNGDGTAFLYTSHTSPPAAGDYLVTLEATDGIAPTPGTYEVAGPVSQTFTLTVVGNTAPTFVSETLLTAYGLGSNIWVVAAQDDNNDKLTFAPVSLPDWLVFQDNGNGTVFLFTLFPVPGNHEISLQVSDGIAPPVVQSFTVVGPVDSDGDLVLDVFDNCTLVSNPEQFDTDGDGFGNRCDADFNGDLTVNLSDYSAFRSAFGTTDPDADFNGDGLVNLSDYSIFRASFGKAPGPSCCAP